MKSILKTNIVQGLKYLASYDYQKIGWFENDQGFGSSFSEDVEAIFDDSGLHDALSSGEVAFDSIIDKALIELEVVCDAIGYNWAGKEKKLLESDQMAIVRELAKRCIKLIANGDFSKSTVQIIETDLPDLDVSFPDIKNI